MTMRSTQGLLSEAWYAAIRSKDLAPAKPYHAEIMEEHVVLWRETSGKVVALEDRCAHRNTPLSEGIIVNSCIECPYHGWRYDGQGRCQGIPGENIDGEPSFKVRVDSFPVQEKDGLVWVWMGRNTAPSREPVDMPKWNDASWDCYYMVTDFENNVTNLIQNFMDVPHTVYVHRHSFRKQKKLKVAADVETNAEGVCVTYHQTQDSIGMGIAAKILNPKKRPMQHTDKFLYPNTSRVDYTFGNDETGFIITSTCTPFSALRTRVYTLISHKLGIPALRFLGRIIFPSYTRKVIQEDVWIMKVNGNNLKRLQNPSTTSTLVDFGHICVENIRDAAVEGKSPSDLPVKTKRMEFWV